NLPGVLEYYIAYQRVSTGVRKKILATLVYPTLLVIVAVKVVTYLITGVVAKIALLFLKMHAGVPTPTPALIALTVDFPYWLLSGIAAFFVMIFALWAWSRSEEGGATFDRLKFRVPVVGETLLKFEVAQFCRTLATLLSGGTPLVAGLQTAGDAIGSRLI